MTRELDTTKNITQMEDGVNLCALVHSLDVLEGVPLTGKPLRIGRTYVAICYNVKA